MQPTAATDDCDESRKPFNLYLVTKVSEFLLLRITCLTNTAFFSQQRRKSSELSRFRTATETAIRKSVVLKPQPLAWRSSPSELMRSEKATREETSSLLF